MPPIERVSEITRPRGRRAKVPRAVREREMLAVAERAFAERGFHAASVDAIAEAAGISKPMVYAYFVLLGEATAGTGPFAREGAELRRQVGALVAGLLRRAAAPEGVEPEELET